MCLSMLTTPSSRSTDTKAGRRWLALRRRRGSYGAPRGAGRLITDMIATTRRLLGMNEQKNLVRADSAYYGFPSISAAINTSRMTSTVKAPSLRFPPIGGRRSIP